MAEQSKYQVKCRLHKGDQVIVTAGKSKGQTGKIDRVDRKTGRVFIGGVNLAKRHTKPSVSSPEGGIVEKVMPLPVSNVALVDPKTKKASRVGYQTTDGKKVRIAKGSKTALS